MTGDTLARGVLAAADRLLRQIQRRSRARALGCMLCDDTALWRSEPPGAIAMLTPFDIVPVRSAVGLVICSNCVGDCSNATLAQTVVSRLRAELMPDLRVLPPMAGVVGHA